MQLERADLRDCPKPLDAIDLQIGFVVAENLDQFQQIGCPAHGMALEEVLALDAVRRADQRAWPSLDVSDHPFANRLEIAGEIEFCDGFAVASVRPHLFLGM